MGLEQRPEEREEAQREEETGQEAPDPVEEIEEGRQAGMILFFLFIQKTDCAHCLFWILPHLNAGHSTLFCKYVLFLINSAKSIRHLLFQGRLRSKYRADPPVLDLTDRTGCRTFTGVWTNTGKGLVRGVLWGSAFWHLGG